MIAGLLAIVAGAIVLNTSFAVPRYSASVPQVGDSNVTHPVAESARAATDNPSAPVLQRIKQEAQMCNSPQPYVTCAYMRPLDAPVVGQVAEATLGEKGVHWQIVIYNAKTGEQIASYGKTTTPIVQGSSVAGLVAVGAVGAIAGALEGTAYGQGIMTHDDPTNNPEYATYRQEPVWCIGSSEISVLKPGYYEVLDTDCREYAERVKDDLLRNKGGREIPAPEYTILSTSCRKGDMSKRETKSTKSASNDVSDDSEKRSVDPEKKTVSNRVGAVNSMSSAVADSGVGVRGWCDCGDDHGKRYIVGDMFCMYEKLECDLAYTLCARCGCVVRPKDCAGEGLQIVDVRLYRELKQEKGGKLSWSDAFDSLKARQSKIEAIPTGQIIVGGLCTCKVTDPISVGFTNKITGEFFVCCNCGRVREPDENGDVPSGPTALSEMGLNEQAEKESERIRNWLEKGKSSK